MQWYLSVLKNYVGFSGRARRKEYWMFTLINAIVGAIINVIQLILGLELPYLSMLYLLATFLPVLALAIRRLHDTDRSGAWALLFFVCPAVVRSTPGAHERYPLPQFHDISRASLQITVPAPDESGDQARQRRRSLTYRACAS